MYLFWSERDDIALDGESVGMLRHALTMKTEPLLLVETVPDAPPVIDAVLASSGAKPLLRATCMEVLEGDERQMSAFTLPTWEHVERCSEGLHKTLMSHGPAIASRVIAFQAGNA